MRTTTKNERALIARLKGLRSVKVKRKSDRPYDLSLRGEQEICDGRDVVLFSSWLPLHAIRELTEWTRDEIADMSDYPEMVAHGDWSGIRDSRPEVVWAIFEEHVLGGRK